jgi:dipeptidyl aminopeptidase/acylaminoacyl peptidase
MGNIPILLRHGYDDDMTPVEHSRRFYAEAQKLNRPVEYIEVAGSHISVAKDLHQYVFAFFSQAENQ